MSQVEPIPSGYHTVTPHLVIDGCAQALDFYVKAFDAQELHRMPGPDGKILHAEMKIGDSIVMMADAMPEMGGGKDPRALGGSAVGLLIYTRDVDAAFGKAVEAGCTVKMEPANMFWGDRYCSVVDPFGHSWSLATHVEDVDPDEMQRRMTQLPA